MLTLDEAKNHLGIPSAATAQDNLIQGYLDAAEASLADWTHRQFISAQYRLNRMCFPGLYGPLYLPLAPLTSIELLKYDNNQGTETDLAGEYETVIDQEPGYAIPKAGSTWPKDLEIGGAATVHCDFTCGFANQAAVPDTIKQAIRVLVGLSYEWRTPVTATPLNQLPFTLEALIRTIRYGDGYTSYVA